MLLDSDVLTDLCDFGINMFDDEIDEVIFETTQFLTSSTFIGESGPFWWILQICLAIGALFSLIVCGQMAYKMMLKGEPLDIMKLFRPFAISVVLFWWYPPGTTGIVGNAGSGSSWCVLDFLSYIPNCIGSYTHDLYEAEATIIDEKFEEVSALMYTRDSTYVKSQSNANVAEKGAQEQGKDTNAQGSTSASDLTQVQIDANKLVIVNLVGGIMVGIDKILMTLSILLFRVGWWATIYSQQILLGMLTIFGPIQWAFSVLPKWEGAWAKWISRYLTAHFYGAMLYFVGFYVLLLYDIVLSIQLETMTAITASEEATKAYLQQSFLTSAYFVAAGLVAMQCLSMVPDLASWMIPEGDVSFAARNFGHGVAAGAQGQANQAVGKVMSAAGA